MTHTNIFAPISEELGRVEQDLTKTINSNMEMLNQASNHLIKAGGKRIRPAFALLAAKTFREDIELAIPVATALELTHLATLVHDDVIDNSLLRRGDDTVKSVWGNRVSINAGNYILARALSLLADYDRPDVLEVFADASMKICEGEIIQMISAYNVQVGLKNYLRRIERKTALLIALSCQMGAMICNAPPSQVKILERYGYYLGMAFQVTDDILDIVADPEVIGKPTGSDIKQGVITLPAIYALHHSPDKAELAEMLSSPEHCLSRAERIVEIICESDGLDYAYYVTEHFSRRAQKQLHDLPDSPAKETLVKMAEFVSGREY